MTIDDLRHTSGQLHDAAEDRGHSRRARRRPPASGRQPEEMKPTTGERASVGQLEHAHDRVRRAARRASRRRTSASWASRTPGDRRSGRAPPSTPSPGRALSPIRRRRGHRCGCSSSEPGSHRVSSRPSASSGIPRGLRSRIRRNDRGAHAGAPRHRTALWPPNPNEFESAIAALPCPLPCTPAAAVRRARSRGRGPRPAARSRASAAPRARAAPAPWRSPRPRRRRRAGGRSRTSSRTPGSLGARSPSASLSATRLGAVVERRRGAVGVDVVDVRGRRGRRPQRARDRRWPPTRRSARARSGGRRRRWRRTRAPRPARARRALARQSSASRAPARPLPRPSRTRRGARRTAARCRLGESRLHRRERGLARAASASPPRRPRRPRQPRRSSIIRAASPIACAPDAQAGHHPERRALRAGGASPPGRPPRCP